MAKYYVQSGKMRIIVQAESSRKAAIWAVHQAMQQVLPVDDDYMPLKPSEQRADQQVVMLTKRMTVSERGFGAEQVIEFSTLEVISQWNQMVTTLDRLEQMMHHAA